MAGEWIPVSTDLPHKREVLAIARRTGRNHYEVAGRLLAFWAWAQKETTDGVLVDVDVDALVTALGPDERYWRAVVAVGWLIETQDGLLIPHWDRWLARGAKSRLSNTLRQGLWRNRNGSVDGPVDATVTEGAPTNPLPQDRTGQDKKESGEDEDEESSSTPDKASPDHCAEEAIVYLDTAFAGKILDPRQFVIDLRARFPALDLTATFREAHASLAAGNIPRSGSVHKFLLNWVVNNGTRLTATDERQRDRQTREQLAIARGIKRAEMMAAGHIPTPEELDDALRSH